MAKHNQIGHYGEALACIYIEKLGFEILHLNWRHKNWEIDIIARKQEKLHFIEVKTRRTNIYGYPEDLVDKNKLRYFISAGTAYIRRNKGFRWIRFDILSITLDAFDKPSFFLIEDVYF